MTTTTIRIGNETARVGDFIVFTASRSRDDWDWGEIMGIEEVDGVASGVTVVQADIYWHGSETRHSMADEQLEGARVYRTIEGAREAFRRAAE